MSQDQERSPSSIANDIYSKGRSLHDLRLSYVDDSEDFISTSEGKLDNPFLSLTRHEIDEARREYPSDYETEGFQLDIALRLLDKAESAAKKALIDGKAVALGYTNTSDEAPRLVPSRYWHFLTVNFEKNTAEGRDLHYVGLRIVDAKDLSEEELKVLSSVCESAQASPDSDGGGSKVDIDNPFNAFRKMNSLRWDEVEIVLVAGELIEISARNTTKTVTGGELDLIDRRTGKGGLNKSGIIFVGMAINERTGKDRKGPSFSTRPTTS